VAEKNRKYYFFIVATTFLALVIAMGVRSTPGVFIAPFERYFGWTRADIGVALAVNLSLYGLLGPFASAFINRWGARCVFLSGLIFMITGAFLSIFMTSRWQLVLYWGFFVGTGSGLLSTVAGNTVATQWFVKGRGLVIGIFGAGGAVGQLIFLPLFAKLLETTSWQVIFILIAASASIVGFVILVFIKNKPEDLGLLPYGAISKPPSAQKSNPVSQVFLALKQGFVSKDFWVISSSLVICGATSSGLGSYLRTVLGDYVITFVSGGLLCVLASAIVLKIPKHVRYNQ